MTLHPTHLSDQRWRTVSLVAALAAAVWLLSPAATASHLECFTQRLQSLAIMDLRGALADDDFNYPIFTEYLYTTRVGLVQLLEWTMRLTGSMANGHFQAILLVSLVSVFASCIAFAKRWADEPPWAVTAALFLTPGFVESTFYFADNLPSAAFAIGAMALVARRMSASRWVATGGLFAASVLTRLDAVYILPFFPGLFLLGERRSMHDVAAAVAGFAGGAVFLFVASWLASGVDLVTSLRIGAMWARVHMSDISLRHDTALVAAGFFGLLLPVLLLIGAVASHSRHARRWSLVVTLLPALFYLYVTPKVLEPRVLLLLGLPFLALHGATGVRVVIESLWDPRAARRYTARGAVALAALSYLVPPVMFERDGPRTIVGRIWSPLLWREWQARETGGESRVLALVDNVQPAQSVFLISTTWQADSIVHLSLLQRGWDKQRQAAAAASLCERLAEVYTKGTRRVVQYRMEDPFDYARFQPVALPRNYVSAYELKVAADCVQSGRFDAGYLVDWDKHPYALEHISVSNKSPQPRLDIFPVAFPLPLWQPRLLRQLRIIPLRAPELSVIQTEAARVMQDALTKADAQPPVSDAALREAYQARLWHPEQPGTDIRTGSKSSERTAMERSMDVFRKAMK